MRLRAIRPPDDITPNANDPASVPPSTVGPDQLVTPGDPSGVNVTDSGPVPPPPGRVLPSGWSGWPADWWPPTWAATAGQSVTPTAYMCVDLNASVLASLPPYLVGAAPSLDAGWIVNPDPDHYTSWDEFAKRLFWDYQAQGEAFVLATAWYASGWPARFHVIPFWGVTVEYVDGVRRYTIGAEDVTAQILHIRYSSTTVDPRGHGPLEAAAGLIAAERALSSFAAQFATAGGVPPTILTHPEDLTAQQAADLQAQWVTSRQSQIGEPAVLSGGVQFQAVGVNPKDAALVELARDVKSQIAVLLGVPPFLVGLPTGDPMTYRNVNILFDYHWRAGLRPKAQAVMGALSGWLLPRGTTVELNRDAYVQPEPLERAQVAQIYNSIRDTPGGPPVLSVDEIRAIERIQSTGVSGVAPPPGEATTGAPLEGGTV